MSASRPYCSVAEVREQIGKLSPAKDAIIEAIIIEASEWIDRFCNRPDGFKADGQADARVFVGKGTSVLYIDECAAVETLEVKRDASDDSFVLWETGDFYAASGDPRRPDFNRTPYHFLIVNPYGNYSIFPSGQSRGSFRNARRPGEHATIGVPTVRVTANWGYALDTPPVIKQACITQTVRWFKRGEGAWGDSIGSVDTGEPQFRKVLDPEIESMLVRGRYKRRAMGGR